jgi:hypothetical protein
VTLSEKYRRQGRGRDGEYHTASDDSHPNEHAPVSQPPLVQPVGIRILGSIEIQGRAKLGAIQGRGGSHVRDLSEVAGRAEEEFFGRVVAIETWAGRRVAHRGLRRQAHFGEVGSEHITSAVSLRRSWRAGERRE